MKRVICSNRSVGLDILRIIACLGVVCIHEMYINKPRVIANIFSFGDWGVTCFFLLSGYFAARELNGSNVKNIDYIKKRFLRIIPTYYLAIVLIISFLYFQRTDIQSDIFGLGWLRYFLFLNTILPSNNFDIWNNLFGLWTISNFIFFYVLAPFLLKKTNFIKLLSLCAVSFSLKYVWKVVIIISFRNIEGLEKVDVLAGTSPIGTLYQFLLGALVYLGIKERRKIILYLGATLLLVTSVITCKTILIYCAVSILLILIFEGVAIKQSRILRTISNSTYYVYLCHELSFEIAYIALLRDRNGVYHNLEYIIISIAIMIVFCMIMGCFDRMIKRKEQSFER